MGTCKDETRLSVDALNLEASVLLGHRQAAQLLFKRLVGLGSYTSGIYFPTSIGRHLGGAAALLGRNEDARDYYNQAIKVCTKMKFRPELALTYLQFAELLLKCYPLEKEKASKYLDFAIKEFQDMKMESSLERALESKVIIDM